MAAFFGIDRTYFDEIDEEKRNELIQKAMYFYQKDGKEIYLYRPNKTPKSHDETVTYFQKDREKSLDEEYLLAKKRKQQTIQEIEKQIEDKKETDCLLTKISHLHRGCDVYEITSKLFKKMKKEKAFLKIPYFCELMNVWKAMLLAYELLDEKSLSEEKVEWEVSTAGVLMWKMLIISAENRISLTDSGSSEILPQSVPESGDPHFCLWGSHFC